MSHYLVAVILDGDEINKVQERFKDNEIKKISRTITGTF